MQGSLFTRMNGLPPLRRIARVIPPIISSMVSMMRLEWGVYDGVGGGGGV